MVVAVADTHAVIWYLANDSRLSAKAKQAFEDAARYSPAKSANGHTTSTRQPISRRVDTVLF
jgi:hypothetical protein